MYLSHRAKRHCEKFTRCFRNGMCNLSFTYLFLKNTPLSNTESYLSIWDKIVYRFVWNRVIVFEFLELRDPYTKLDKTEVLKTTPFLREALWYSFFSMKLNKTITYLQNTCVFVMVFNLFAFNSKFMFIFAGSHLIFSGWSRKY